MLPKWLSVVKRKPMMLGSVSLHPTYRKMAKVLYRKTGFLDRFKKLVDKKEPP
jgi:hypothetical protein